MPTHAVTCSPDRDENPAETPLDAPPGRVVEGSGEAGVRQDGGVAPAQRRAPGAVRVHDLGHAGPVPGVRRVPRRVLSRDGDRDKLHQAVKPLALTEGLVTVAPA